jgi:hypothetical protein
MTTDTTTTTSTTMVDPNEIDIDAITYAHSVFGANFFYLDQILDRMAPISRIIGQAPQLINIGALTVLPHKLLLLVLESLPIADLMRFRRCNRSSSHFVDKVLQPALSIAPNTIKGILALQVTAHITACQLSCKLRQRHCDATSCGALAQYMFLPTCARLCYMCCALRPRAVPLLELVHEEEAALLSEQEKNFLATQPSLRTLPATFTNGINKFQFTRCSKVYAPQRNIFSIAYRCSWATREWNEYYMQL